MLGIGGLLERLRLPFAAPSPSGTLAFRSAVALCFFPAGAEDGVRGHSRFLDKASWRTLSVLWAMLPCAQSAPLEEAIPEAGHLLHVVELSFRFVNFAPEVPKPTMCIFKAEGILKGLPRDSLSGYCHGRLSQRRRPFASPLCSGRLRRGLALLGDCLLYTSDAADE